MNLIILKKNDFLEGSTTALLRDRRFKHITDNIKVKEGDALKVGMLNGKIGSGVVTSLSEHELTIDVSISDLPPPPLPLTLVLALPRPKVLRRVIQHATTLGVKEFYIIKTWRVEKSYFATPYLSEEKMMEEMMLGLEQARDTILPRFHVRKLFKPFVEDELPAIIEGKQAVVAHPTGKSLDHIKLNSPTVLAVGPEGGFIPYEIALLQKVGFQTLSLGPRILRVETAVPWILAKLY